MSSSEHIYYQSIRVLGIAEGATPQEIKDSYRRLSKKYHPDVFKGDGGEQFKAINAAYSYLKSHPEPPEKVFKASAQPIYQENYRDEHRKRYWAKKRKEHELKEQMFKMIFQRMRILITVITFFNIGLVTDYFLLSSERQSILVKTENIVESNSRSGSGRFFYTELTFEGGYKMLLDSKVEDEFQRGSSYKLIITPVFKQIKILYNSSGNQSYAPSYNIFNVFGFLIAIVLVCSLLYFFLLKNNDSRLTMIILIIFSFLVQLVLLFS